MGLISGALASVLAAVTFFAVPGSPPVVVDSFSGLVEAATGVGWAVHPDSTDDAGLTFVEGPATPPLGRGSLELYTPAVEDRALAFTVPTGEPGQVLPTPVAWSTLSASYATFIPEGAGPSSTPTLRIVGYHVLEPDLTGFTTLSFQPPADMVESGVWQTWEIGPESEVFQSNDDDEGFCIQSDPCTLSAFALRYLGGGWGEVQVGLGAGAGADAVGYADAVLVRDGTTAEYFYDFEVPAAVASIAAGPATATGGSATVTLDASAISATETVPFTITVTLPDGSVQTEVVDVDAGTTLDVSIPVPFGTTHIVVEAQGTVIAEGDVTFTAAVTPPVTTLPPTGFDPIAAVWGSGLLAAGLALFAAGRVRVRVRSEARIG